MTKYTNQKKTVTFMDKIFTKFVNKLNPYFKEIRRLLNIKTQYHYDKFSILLPYDHLLPIYQNKHIKYDRFLPHLAKYIECDETVVDVGANCADTLASMIENNQSLKFVCIEPDDMFFNYLNANITRIKKVHQDISVRTVKSLVGKSIVNVSLEGKDGTKHAVEQSNGSHSSETLDNILSNLGSPSVRMLKSDVDGFDYDVIDSALTTLTTQHPIIFFECQYDFDYQKTGYRKTISWLKSIGYSDWILFDNFGELVIRTKDLDQIFQLMDYVWKQNIKLATRTIYYFDVLAITKKDSSLIDKVLSDY